MSRGTLYGDPMRIVSLSIREEHRQLLLVLGRGNLSSGLRELVERVGKEELQELRRRTHELRAKEEYLKQLREEGNGDGTLETDEAIPEERSRVPRKKKRARIAR